MVGIVYATRREAAALLSQTSASPLAAHPFQTFRADGAGHPPCLVAVSGMGKVAAAAAASHLVLAHRVSMLVNAGLCGRLTMPTIAGPSATCCEFAAPWKVTVIDSAARNRPWRAIPDGSVAWHLHGW
jgi:hypothetical protein